MEGYDGGVVGHAGASGNSRFGSEARRWELDALRGLLGIRLDGLLEF